MRKLLLKLFIKDYKNTKNQIVRTKYGSLSGVIGIVANLFLCFFKILAGVLSGSLSIMADGINNFSDAGTSIITLIGFKLSNKPADEDHPFGHERIEYLTGVIVSFIILVIGGILGYESINKFITTIKNPTSIKMDISIILYIILGVSIVVKCWLAYFNYKNGKSIDSATLLATSQDSLNDCISTISVIVGMIVFQLSNFSLDGVIGIIVSVFILLSGIKTLKETMNPLIGEEISIELQTEIKEFVLSYPGILGVHDLIVHSYGPNKIFATIHAEVSSAVDILESHDIIDNIERDYKNKTSFDLVIHMDPVDITNPETIKLKNVVLEIMYYYDSLLTIHDFRVVFGNTHTNVLFDIAMPLKYPKNANEVKTDIIKLIKEYDSKLNPVIQIDQHYERNK